MGGKAVKATLTKQQGMAEWFKSKQSKLTTLSMITINTEVVMMKMMVMKIMIRY